MVPSRMKPNCQYPSLIRPRSFGRTYGGACKIDTVISAEKSRGFPKLRRADSCVSLFLPWPRSLGGKKKPAITCSANVTLSPYTRPLFHRGLSPSSLSVGCRSTGPAADRPTAFMFGRAEEEKSLHKKPLLHVRGLVTTARTTTTADIGRDSLSIDFALDMYPRPILDARKSNGSPFAFPKRLGYMRS